jgi:hypothetical protein
MVVVSKGLQTLNEKRLLSKEEVLTDLCFNAVDKQFYCICCVIQKQPYNCNICKLWIHQYKIIKYIFIWFLLVRNNLQNNFTSL